MSSEPLEGMLEWENKTDQTVDLDLFSVGRVGPVAKFTCEGVGVEVKGSVLANIKEDKAVTLYKPKLSGKRGKQKPTEYETSEGAKVPDFLEMSVAEAAFEQSGLTVKGFTLTSKEAIEINTIV